MKRQDIKIGRNNNLNKNCSTDIWSFQIGLTYDDLCNFPSNYHFKITPVKIFPDYPPPPPFAYMYLEEIHLAWILMQIVSFNYLYLQSNWKVTERCLLNAQFWHSVTLSYFSHSIQLTHHDCLFCGMPKF